jgi:putative hydrolase
MLARQYGASLVLNTDAHGPQDFISLETARKIARGAGLALPEIDRMFGNSEALIRKILNKQG